MNDAFNTIASAVATLAGLAVGYWLGHCDGMAQYENSDFRLHNLRERYNRLVGDYHRLETRLIEYQTAWRQQQEVDRADWWKDDDN